MTVKGVTKLKEHYEKRKIGTDNSYKSWFKVSVNLKRGSKDTDKDL